MLFRGLPWAPDRRHALGVGVPLSAVTAGVRLGLVGEGRLVDPFSTDGLGQHIGGRLVVFNHHVGVVLFPASGHGCVDACMVGRLVNEEEGGVSGAALGGM